jgi:hypothetical protein
MAAELISTPWGDRVDVMLDDFERNPRRPPPGSGPGPGSRPPLTGILLEDLQSQAQADVAVLAKVAAPNMQKISIDGVPSIVGNSRPTFTLVYGGQTTTAIDYQATAAQVQKALQALSTIGPNNVTVALGTQAPNQRSVIVNATGGTFTLSLNGLTTVPIAWNASAATMQTAFTALTTCTVTGGSGQPWLISAVPPSVSLAGLIATPTGLTGGAKNVTVGQLPGVWIVSFVGKFQVSGAAPPTAITTGTTTGGSGFWVVIEANTIWQDTGAVETINAFIPVGSPTPMRAGAAVIGLWAPGVGYVLISCEPREYPAVAGY